MASAAAAQPAELQAPKLTRIAVTLKQGDPWLDVKAGLVCFKRGTLKWEVADRDLSPTGDLGGALGGMFERELQAAGLPVAGVDRSNLFVREEPNVDIQVGALIKRLNGAVCYPLAGYESDDGAGEMTMEVEWQVYSVSQNAVIGRISTTSVATSGRKLRADPALGLIVDAFQLNARALAARPEFRELLARQAAPSPATTPLPGSDLAIRLAPSGSAPLDRAARAVVSVFAGGGHGSGVLISQDGYVLTNHHVAGSSGPVRLRWADGSETVGSVVRADARRDVALIRTTPKAAPLAIRHTPVALGETVFAIGTPHDRAFEGTLTRGVVSTVARSFEGQVYIQSDVSVTHGNSGGPLLDEAGRVVGLTDLGIAPDGVSLNLNLFIPIAEALRVLRILPAA